MMTIRYYRSACPTEYPSPACGSEISRWTHCSTPAAPASVFPQELASQLKFSSEPVVFGNGESLSSHFLIKAGILGSDVQVGQYTFSQPFVEVNSAFPQVNFGSCPMQHFSFTFDQANLLMRLEASEKVLHLAATPTRPRLQNAPTETARARPRPHRLAPFVVCFQLS